MRRRLTSPACGRLRGEVRCARALQGGEFSGAVAVLPLRAWQRGDALERPSPPTSGNTVLELIVISTLNGVLFGMLLFLMASGLTVIFSMLGVLNFAHASFYMLGAFFGFQIGRWFGFWPALVVAPVLAGAIGAGVERYGLRRVHKNGHG